jgi:hypothetical protein
MILMLPGTCGRALQIGRRYKSGQRRYRNEVNEDIEARSKIDLYTITDFTENKFSEKYSVKIQQEISMMNADVSNRADA